MYNRLDKDSAWYSELNPLSAESYEPHMLYCIPN